MTRLWIVRLGKFGEREAKALESGELVTGWTIEDLSNAKSKQAILEALQRAEPQESPGTLQNWSAQLNQLCNSIEAGDLVVTPLKTTGQLALGRVVGGYQHTDGKHPTRRVTWLVTDLPRDAVKQDLIFSLGASQTVCEISRNNAVERFEALVKTRVDPGYDGTAIHKQPQSDQSRTDEVEETVNLADAARAQIERRIASSFAGHAFTQLIAEILRAQGYQTRVTPPGADRGIDIVAGQGPLGFSNPRLVVQVKSGDIVADQPTLQGLIGCVQDAHADHGLLVSWSGFKAPVRQRVNELYFRVRLWGRDEILDALFSVYDQLPEEIRAELPLRRVWALVMEEAG